MRAITRAFLARLAGFRRHQGGNVGITFALSAVPLLSLSGIALDYTRALKSEHMLQTAADAAALSAARQGNYSDQQRRDMAEAMFEAHMSANGLKDTVTPQIGVSGQTINIDIALDVPTTFARLAGQSSFRVAAHAQAIASNGMVTGGTACVLALNATASDAFSINGTTDYKAVDCSTYSNSTASTSLRAVGVASAEATAFYTAGEVSGESRFEPPPLVDQPPLANPLEDLPEPSSSACSSNAKGTSLKKGSHVLNPGTFCGGLKLQAQAVVDFNPGIYVIKNGQFEISSGASAYGEGVHFHFVGSGATLKVRGGADADFKAPTTGTYAGILFAQEPDASPGDVSDVQGGGTVRLVGALYFPTQQVDVGGNGDLGLLTDAWAIIADKVRVHGNGQVRLKADFTSVGFPEILPKIGLKPPHLTQ